MELQKFEKDLVGLVKELGAMSPTRQYPHEPKMDEVGELTVLVNGVRWQAKVYARQDSPFGRLPVPLSVCPIGHVVAGSLKLGYSVYFKAQSPFLIVFKLAPQVSQAEDDTGEIPEDVLADMVDAGLVDADKPDDWSKDDED